jgi:sulfoxide reductase heme-binding subunit YedZ
MIDGPLFWYVNRATGVVALVLLTLTTVLGVVASGARPGRGLPGFVTQAVHRNVALLAVVLLFVHVASAVVDQFVDIRWWQAVLPFGASYQPLWLGLGAAAVDLLVVVVVTSLLRARMRYRSWRVLHLAAYALWALAMAHGIGIGTDLAASWWLITVGCAGSVAVAAVLRVGQLLNGRPSTGPALSRKVST